MVWIRMSLQRANTNVKHVYDVVIRCEAGARLIILAIERQVVIVPLAILFVVCDVLKESVRVRIRIRLAHALLHTVGPAGDVGECFAGLQYLRNPLSSSWLDAQRSDFANGLMTVVTPGHCRHCRSQEDGYRQQQRKSSFHEYRSP